MSACLCVARCVRLFVCLSVFVSGWVGEGEYMECLCGAGWHGCGCGWVDGWVGVFVCAFISLGGERV